MIRKEFDYVLTENPQVNETLSQYELPIVTHSTIESDGYGTSFLPALHRQHSCSRQS